MLSSRQWSEWIAYYRVEPFGHDQICVLLSQIASILVNVNRAKGSKMVRPSEFYNRLSIGRKQSVEEIKTLLTAIAVKKKGKGGKDA